MENTSTIAGWKTGLILFLMFVVLPAGSWYYLQAGANYRKSLLAKLGDYGEMPVVDARNYDNAEVVTKNLGRALFIVNFSDFRAGKETEEKIQFLQKLHKQFDFRKDVFFLNFVTDSSFFEKDKLSQFLSETELTDNRQLFFLYPSNIDARSAFHFPFREGEDESVNTYFSLVDMDGKIRGFYNVAATNDQKLMVEHIAILLPVVKMRKTFKENE